MNEAIGKNIHKYNIIIFRNSKRSNLSKILVNSFNVFLSKFFKDDNFVAFIQESFEQKCFEYDMIIVQQILRCFVRKKVYLDPHDQISWMHPWDKINLQSCFFQSRHTSQLVFSMTARHLIQVFPPKKVTRILFAIHAGNTAKMPVFTLEKCCILNLKCTNRTTSNLLPYFKSIHLVVLDFVQKKDYAKASN